jgi:endogenous inhibitor of DNA gyrase (YacG/DUF329 family)
MSEDIKTASVWTEEVYFTECPTCGALVTIGTDAIINPGDSEQCSICNETFLLEVKERGR